MEIPARWPKRRLRRLAVFLESQDWLGVKQKDETEEFGNMCGGTSETIKRDSTGS